MVAPRPIRQRSPMVRVGPAHAGFGGWSGSPADSVEYGPTIVSAPMAMRSSPSRVDQGKQIELFSPNA